MIFVTVGTHEQPFDRLVRNVDGLVENGVIKETVIMQTGYCTYAPKCCKASKWFTYAEMVQHVADAHIVITHGGPSSFIMPLQMGKIPIVVPRNKAFGEHINDHQIEFCHEVEKRYHNLLVVDHIDELGHVLRFYNILTEAMSRSLGSNNEAFNRKLENIVDGLFGK